MAWKCGSNSCRASARRRSPSRSSRRKASWCRASSKISTRARLLEHLVAGEVSHAVVDDLEAVQVEEQHGEAPLAVAPVTRQRAAEPIQQIGAVGQPRQRVVHRLVLELLLDALAYGDLV